MYYMNASGNPMKKTRQRVTPELFAEELVYDGLESFKKVKNVLTDTFLKMIPKT